MSIFYNGTDVSGTKYGIASSAKIKESNHLYDLVDTVNDVQNGANVKVGAFTGNGLQERTAVTAGVKDQIVFVCSPALISDTSTSERAQEYNFINKKGIDFKAYEIDVDDVIAISEYSIAAINSTTDKVVKGNYVVSDGARGWTEVATASAASYGYIGQIIGFQTQSFQTIVLINTVQNTTVA